MKSRSMHLEPIKVRQSPGHVATAAPASRLLHALHDATACGSFSAATDAVQAPEALATPPGVRARRQMRTARVSWW